MAATKKCPSPWACAGCGENKHKKNSAKCRCKLRPHSEGCPPEKPRKGRKPKINKHHVIPDRWWDDASGQKRAACAPSFGEGLCICVRGHGKSQEHGKIHDLLRDEKKKSPAKLSFEEAKSMAAQSVVDGMSDPKCDVED